jgi:hypothetical protein
VPGFTRDNHFRFGFDGEAFNNRPSLGARYWTEHGRVMRPHRGFVAELELALQEIAARLGRFSIAGTGGAITTGAALVARRLGLGFVVTRVTIDGWRPPPPPRGAIVEEHRESWDGFANFALAFAGRSGCGDAWTALGAFFGALSEYPQIGDGGELRIVNNGFDEIRRTPAGPANWTLVDNEKFTAINRWLIAEGREGVPQLMRWSPELMAAQLDSDPWRRWLKAATANGSVDGDWANLIPRLQLWRESFPGERFVSDARRASRDIDFDQRMRALGKRMLRANPGCASQHHMPLHRLARDLRVAFDFPLGEGPEVYGSVAAERIH